MTELYRSSGLDIYEKSHYARGEHLREVEEILSWYRRRRTRVLDVGCSGGFHALEFARRGFSVTGVDLEPSAIERALARSREEGLSAAFSVLDLEKDDMVGLGTFDFIYSIGNVFSHVKKGLVPDIFRKVRGCLSPDGIFLFDLLMKGRPFREELYEEDLKIAWKRVLHGETDRISMEGFFQDFNFVQHFEVWGYSTAEVLEALTAAGFRQIDFSETLDFSSRVTESDNPVFLNFRAATGEGS